MDHGWIRARRGPVDDERGGRVPSMEMEEMNGRCAGGMSPRSWNSAARQELAQPAPPPPTCLASNSDHGWLHDAMPKWQNRRTILPDRSAGRDRSAKPYRWCVSSFPFGMDGALPVDQSVSCPGCSEVYPEEQRRAGGGTTTSWWILPAEHRDPCPRCYRAALNSPKP